MMTNEQAACREHFGTQAAVASGKRNLLSMFNHKPGSHCGLHIPFQQAAAARIPASAFDPQTHILQDNEQRML
jgi:hypothetical protein